MMTWLLSSALAAELQLVGFSPTGHLVTFAVVRPFGNGTQIELQTLDVAAGTWNHLPVQGGGPTPADAITIAIARVPAGYAVPQREAVAPTPLRFWSEGARAHDHVGTHSLIHRVLLPRVTAGVRVDEVPVEEDCGGLQAIEPHVWWTTGALPVDRLADRVPRRWPACTLTVDLVAAWLGPRGGVLLVLRALHGSSPEAVDTGWIVLSAREVAP